MRKTGTYQKLGDLEYFTPFDLPPENPGLKMNSEIVGLYGEASFALGQLNEMSERLPDGTRFIKAYVIKEALLSSAIEGIHTTLLEILTQPIGESKPSKDTQLVLNYTKALEVALGMIQDEKLPLTTKVLLKAHESLMNSGEGDKFSPGLFRKQSVKVGDLIPPPANKVIELMSSLEKYINAVGDIPPLIIAGLVHVQFETIHPFLDGNGRIGRLLIVLMLIDRQLLKSPILYPSYYFKKYHLEYYQYLDKVRTEGDFEGWICFYLKAITESAKDAYKRASDIELLEINLRKLIQEDPAFKKMRETAAKVLDVLFLYPIANITDISKNLGKAYNTVHKILKEFEKHNIVKENSLGKRSKTYRFNPYLELLEKEYDTDFA